MTTIETATELVLAERHDGVLTITINRPADNATLSTVRSLSRWRPPWICWIRIRRCRWACSPAPAGRSARVWT